MNGVKAGRGGGWGGSGAKHAFYCRVQIVIMPESVPLIFILEFIISFIF